MNQLLQMTDLELERVIEQAGHEIGQRALIAALEQTRETRRVLRGEARFDGCDVKEQ